MQIFLAILQGLAGIGFVINGLMKLIGIGPSPQHLREFRYPVWFLKIVGVIELIIGGGLLAGFRFAPLIFIAAILLLCTMLGAIGTHFWRKRATFFPDAFPASIGFIIACILIISHL